MAVPHKPRQVSTLAWPGWLGALIAAAEAEPEYDAFGGPIRARLEGTNLHACGREPPPVDLKLLHAKIGELTLEKDFLSGALSKAGLLSAKR